MGSTRYRKDVNLMLNQKYEHIIVVAIDGGGAFLKETPTPCFDKIFANGAVTYQALSSRPTISAECYGSMLTGTGPEIHGFTNAILWSTPNDINSPNPSLFRRIREVMPEAELGSYCDWNPITHGIVENNLGVSHDTARDTELTPIVCDYIREKKPTFLFVQLDSVDGAGHTHGYGTPQHLNRITEVDLLVNDIYNAVGDAGILEDTLFMVITDHGGFETTHGGWTDGEKYVTFGVTGKNVQNTAITEMNIRDLSAIVLYALGIEIPAFDEKGWTSQIPVDIWTDETIPEYRDISHLTGAAPRISREAHTSELI